MKGQSEAGSVEVKEEEVILEDVEGAHMQEEKHVLKVEEEKQKCNCDNDNVRLDCDNYQCPYQQYRYEKFLHYTKYQEKKFKCDQCPYAAFQNGFLQQHIEKVHNNPPPSKPHPRLNPHPIKTFMKQNQLPRAFGLLYKRKLIWDEQKVTETTVHFVNHFIC